MMESKSRDVLQAVCADARAKGALTVEAVTAENEEAYRAGAGALKALMRDASPAYAEMLRVLDPANEKDRRLILSLYAREAREAMGKQD